MTGADLPPMPRLPSRGGRARRAPRARTLSRETITAAALRIIDTEGLDAMTMRTVAQSLGTGPASLYAHVASKEELLELVIDHVIGEVPPGENPDPERWQEQLKQGLRAVRAVFARHGDLARASFARIPLGESALRTTEWMIEVMRAGGLPDQVIAFACDLLPLYTLAIAYEESLYQREINSPADLETFDAAMRDYFAALPARRFPNIVALATPLTAGADEDRFEFGLDVLMAGLAAMASSAAPD